MKVPFSKVDCNGNELTYIKEVLSSGWLTTASKTIEFEEKFAQMVGVKHALAVNSCTSALHLALESLGVGPGDRVLVPTLTFTATAEIVRYLGAEPYFVDVDYRSGLICYEATKKAIKNVSNIKACMVVHFAGQSADMLGNRGILDLCESNGIKVVQDAAHAFPSQDTYGSVGSIGELTCFSFYANKTITTGEGGMLVTNNDAYAERIKLMRLHGINRDVWKRFTTKSSSWEYDVIEPGFKYNMPDLNSAVGLAQLERAEEFRLDRQRCALDYIEWIDNEGFADRLALRVKPEWHSWHLFPILLAEPDCELRNRLILALSEDGIGTSVHYKPLHRMTYYKDKYNLKAESFPNAELFWKSCISLPIYSSLQANELCYVKERVSYHAGKLL